jgi:AcrR family transcriptional regulator
MLAAARDEFAAHGFRGATLRGIADRAGVDTGMIRHYFRNKQTLFEAALEVSGVPTSIVAALAGGPEGAGERLARAALSLWEDPITRKPLLATVASALSNSEAMHRLRAIVFSQVLRESLPFLPDDTPDLRLALPLSHLLGIAFARHIVGVGPLATIEFESLIAAIAPEIQRYLTEPLPSASEV